MAPQKNQEEVAPRPDLREDMWEEAGAEWVADQGLRGRARLGGIVFPVRLWSSGDDPDWSSRSAVLPRLHMMN